MSRQRRAARLRKIADRCDKLIERPKWLPLDRSALAELRDAADGAARRLEQTGEEKILAALEDDDQADDEPE